MLRRTTISIFSLLGLVTASQAIAQTPSGNQPTTPIEMVERAIELINAGDFNTAARLIQDATVSQPDLKLLSLAQGLLYKANRQDIQAIGFLETYNGDADGRVDYRGFAAVGEIYLRNRKYTLARGVLETASELAPIEEDGRAVRARITAQLAQAWVSLDQPRKAIIQLKEAQSGSVDDPETQLLICSLAANVKDSSLANLAADNAINGFNQQLRLSPFRRSSYENLIACFEVLIELAGSELNGNPNDAQAFLRAARLMKELGTLQRRIHLIDARELVLQAIEKGGMSTDSMLLAAEIEAELGGVEQARARIEEILKQDAENARAQQLLQSLERLGASSAFGR